MRATSGDGAYRVYGDADALRETFEGTKPSTLVGFGGGARRARARRLVALGNARRGDARGATRNCRVGVVGTDEDRRAERRPARRSPTPPTSWTCANDDDTPVTDRATSEPPWITVARPRSAAMWLSTSARYRIPTRKAHESSDELESAEDDDDPSRISVAGDDRENSRPKVGGSRHSSRAFARAGSTRARHVATDPAAEQLKAHGNAMYQRGKYGAAIDAYTEAITLCPRWLPLVLNRALCHRKRKNWAAVKEDCVKALDIDRESIKAKYMFGLSLIAERRFTEVRRKGAPTRSSRARDPSVPRLSSAHPNDPSHASRPNRDDRARPSSSVRARR